MRVGKITSHPVQLRGAEQAAEGTGCAGMAVGVWWRWGFQHRVQCWGAPPAMLLCCSAEPLLQNLSETSLEMHPGIGADEL